MLINRVEHEGASLQSGFLKVLSRKLSPALPSWTILFLLRESSRHPLRKTATSSIDGKDSCVTVTLSSMSASKLDTSIAFGPFAVQASGQRLTLPADSVRVHKNGIEFRTAAPFAPWTEMTIELETPLDTRRIQANGVVVACTGNRHSGFVVSMVFTHLSPQSQQRLQTLATGYAM